MREVIRDARLDPIWAVAGELGIPIMLHVADAPAFWQAVNDANAWTRVLHGEYAWWALTELAHASPEELRAELSEVVARHRTTTVICPDIASNWHNLDLAADDLETLPNLHRHGRPDPELGVVAPPLDYTRAFPEEHQERVLFGTDVIFNTTNLRTGMQAQLLLEPGEFPARGAVPEDAYADSTAALVGSHNWFLATDEV